jgi:hypothetical protein
MQGGVSRAENVTDYYHKRSANTEMADKKSCLSQIERQLLYLEHF